jgi:adenosylcobinamide-phosphate synthase
MAALGRLGQNAALGRAGQNVAVRVNRTAGWALAAGLAAGVVLDAAFGDPRRGHPVAVFGNAAAALEARDYADSRARGAAHTAACVLAVAVPGAFVQRGTRGRPLLRFASVAAMTWAVTGARSLRRVAGQAGDALDADDLPAARAILPSLCGRDPSGLGGKEIARAVVESVAENTSDAVVAPLLWGAVGGLPGLAAYRAINTLDAMIGHHSPRYERFGWAAARLDDVANYLPARVTALLTVACAGAPAWGDYVIDFARAGQSRNRPARGGGGADAVGAWRAFRRYGARHPSPNAGRCEAAFAGALGIRLGGTNVYQGVAETRQELGDGRPPEPADIRRATSLSGAVTVAAAAVSVAIAIGLSGRRRTRRP